MAHIASLLSYDQMTLEDYKDSYPDEALDTLNKPTYWPHNVEEQLDYEEQDSAPAH